MIRLWKPILFTTVISISLFTGYLMLEQSINVQDITAAKSNFVTLKDGRILEYRVYGEIKEYSKTVVEFNGFGASSLSLFDTFNDHYSKMGIRGIGISLPGFGYSSAKKNRVISNWHLDVDEVLKKEKIEQFWVRGISFGTCHAMEIAHHYGSKRILGLILIAPLIPNDIINTMTVKYDRPPSFLFWDGIGDLFWWLLAGPKFLDSDATLQRLFKDYPELRLKYTTDFARNLNYHGWKESMKTLYGQKNWGFDPRDINLEKIFIMYGEDDVVAPPQFGEWLSKNIMNAVSEKVTGYGHYTAGVPGNMEKFDKSIFNK
jgi:pimeloyl-ACP methyl ester carboxylesterase